MNEQELENIKAEYSAAIGHPANTINALVAEIERLRAAINSVIEYDVIKNSHSKTWTAVIDAMKKILSNALKGGEG